MLVIRWIVGGLVALAVMAMVLVPLFIGIRIARYFNNGDQEGSLALQLRNNFPESVEYQQYKVLISNGN